jgi:hypothetical protein
VVYTPTRKVSAPEIIAACEIPQDTPTLSAAGAKAVNHTTGMEYRERCEDRRSDIVKIIERWCQVERGILAMVSARLQGLATVSADQSMLSRLDYYLQKPVNRYPLLGTRHVAYYARPTFWFYSLADYDCDAERKKPNTAKFEPMVLVVVSLNLRDIYIGQIW